PRDPATLNGSRGDAPGRLSFFVVLWNVGSMRYRELLRSTNVSHPSFILVSLLLVISTHSLQGPSLPERALNRIDAVFFSHVPVCRAIRPMTPETLLDLL